MQNGLFSSDWKQALVTLRGQFYEASQRYTGPRVCWFRLHYPEQVPFEDQRQRAAQLLSMTTKTAEYGSIVVDEDGKQHRYWCAIFDGGQEQYVLFRRLAESAFTQASGGLAHKIGTIPTIMAGWPNGGYCGQPETLYMYWIGAAAFIRHTKPDPLLGLGQIYGGSLPEGAESSAVWNPPEALCSIPMVAVTHHAPFDGIARSAIGWDGPAVIGWETRHDVWRFSVAALDKLIEASAIADAEPNQAADTKPETRKELLSKPPKSRAWCHTIPPRGDSAFARGPITGNQKEVEAALDMRWPTVQGNQNGMLYVMRIKKGEYAVYFQHQAQLTEASRRLADFQTRSNAQQQTATRKPSKKKLPK